MTASRRFLVALAGTEDPSIAELIARVAGLGGAGAGVADASRPDASGPSAEITLLHVEETEPRELAGNDPGLRRGLWPLPNRGAVESRLTAADDEGTEALLAVWRERFAAALPGVEIANLVARGRPEQEIVAAAGRLEPDAVVLCARPRTGPDEPGPRSVGHVARFVLDHSSVPVVLVRHSR